MIVFLFANVFRLKLLDVIVFKRHDDEGVTAEDMPTLDRILEACPNLMSLDVNGFPPALGLRYIYALKIVLSSSHIFHSDCCVVAAIRYPTA